jgi:hyperosmotically inducible periplasmic protein
MKSESGRVAQKTTTPWVVISMGMLSLGALFNVSVAREGRCSMRNILKNTIQVCLTGVLAACLSLMVAQPGAAQQNPAPDNTKANAGDQNHNAVTADQQKENPADRQMVRQIRQAIIKDKSLSTYAHNIKVIVQNGAVTLKGPVRSDDEKNALEAKATEVAGEGKVTNELEVDPKK